MKAAAIRAGTGIGLTSVSRAIRDTMEKCGVYLRGSRSEFSARAATNSTEPRIGN